MRISLWLRTLPMAAAALLFWSLGPCPRAWAFGSFHAAKGEGIVPTLAEVEVIVSDEPGPSVTTVVHLRYQGAETGFAWLIPVPGKPSVALGSSVIFDRLRRTTAPQYWVEVGSEDACKAQVAAQYAVAATDPYANKPDAQESTALRLEQRVLGPAGITYLPMNTGSRGDPLRAARRWLDRHGYALNEETAAALLPYLAAGQNLLAIRVPGAAGTTALQPLALTYQSVGPQLPLRALALGTGTARSVDIRAWFVGPAQAVPTNHRALVLNDTALDWLSAGRYAQGTLPSGGGGPFGTLPDLPTNYGAVVARANLEAGGQGFVTELGEPTSQYRDFLWSGSDQENFEYLSKHKHADGLAAVLAAQQYYGGWDGFRQAVERATTLPAGLTLNGFAKAPQAHRDAVTIDTALFFRELKTTVIEPMQRTAELFRAGPYLTSLYTRFDGGQIHADPVFAFNHDLAQVSPVHLAQQRVACSADGSQATDFRIELPQGALLTSATLTDWPRNAAELPATLKIVSLSARGPGEVVKDNRSTIRARLQKIHGLAEPPWLQQASHGASIGGNHRLVHGYAKPIDPPRTFAENDGGNETPGGNEQPSASGPGTRCSVGDVGMGGGIGSGIGGGREPSRHGQQPNERMAMLPVAWLVMAARRRRGNRAQRARRKRRFVGTLLVLLTAWLAAACQPEPDVSAATAALQAPPSLSAAELRDPETCKDCHPRHYREWSASMHAYAAQDPVFLAMNRRGQRETDGKLGDFCLKCHAPMAVYDGLTKDGLNLEQLADHRRGVSCYFCHNVVGLEGDHNGMLRIANDTVMRGPIRDAAVSPAHGTAYSPFQDGVTGESSAMCGGCHDIVNQNGVHLERTFGEYRHGLFSKSAIGDPHAFETCAGCHMPPSDGYAANTGAAKRAGKRTLHEHLWPGIDVPLTDFPHSDAMVEAVKNCQLGLGMAFFTLEVTPPDLFTFQIEGASGHNLPSGASQDRRMWLEFLAYDDEGKLLEEMSSGHIAEHEIVDKPADDPRYDPQLTLFRDRIFGEDGQPVHMFWEAAASASHPLGYESSSLPVSTTTYVHGKHAILKQYRATGPDGQLPARITARLKMRPMGLDLLQDLVDSGDLDAKFLARMPTFTFPTAIEWKREDGVMKVITAPAQAGCTEYRCLLDPKSDECP